MSKLNKTLDLLHHHGLNDPQNLQDYLQLAELSDDKERLLRAVHATYDRLRDHPSDKAYTDYLKALRFAAPYDFDSYVLFCESLRPPEEQFYLPRRKQLQTISAHLQDLAERKIRFLSISLPPRVGKAQPISSLVLTPTGYVPMGLLEVGDQVIGGDGKPTEIVAIHEQGELDCVSVEMSGGGKVECCTNHLWVASNVSQNKELGTYTTKEIMNTPGAWRIPWVEPIEFSPNAKKPHELPIDPYLMGVLLAQGYWGDVIELRMDDELADILTSTLPEEDQLILHRYLKGNSKSRGRRAIWRIYADPISLIVPETVFLLRELGMGRSPCPLPDMYRYGSPETRRLVLAGILDASGMLLKNRESYIRLFRDSGLLEDAAFLARSLGGSASFVNEPGANRQALFISLLDTPYPTRRPSRQRIRRERVPRRQGYGRILRSITSIGKKPCRCITVANQAGTYVTNTFAVTHNSTLCTFFLSWLMGKYPESTNAMVSYSNSICSTFDKEVRTFITTPSVYRWGEVFPGLQNTMTGSRADLTINLGKPKRFPTLTCRGIDGTWTGAIDVSGLLYSDDLVKNRDEVLNPNRLEKLYQNYLNNVKDRMKEDEGAISLMVGTRWSVFDPIGRELEQNAGDPNYRFVTIPALNEFDESNFVYLYDQGFSTETYINTRNSLAPDEWQAKYMGAPFVREGLLFPSDSLKYYHSLPDADPIRRLAVCDVAFGGGDYLSLVIVGDYGDDGYYLEDVVFNKGHKGVTQELVIAKLLRYMPEVTVFEANAGGGLYAEQVEEEIKKRGVKLNIRSIPTGSQRSKKSRILQYSTDILDMNFLEAPRRSREYASFMTNLCLYTSEGRNVNDDAPDSLALFFEHAAIGGAVLTPMKRPY